MRRYKRPVKRDPVVTIFVRHNKSCRLDGKSFARGCDCPKWLRWFFEGKQMAETTGTRSWERAEELRKAKEDFLRDENSPPPLTPQEEKRTIARARELFLTEKNTEGISEEVFKKYSRETQRFVKFCTDKGLIYPNSIDKIVTLEFKANWEQLYPSSQTRGKVQERFKAFLRFMQDAGWLHRLPKLAKIKVDVPPTMPLTREQYDRLLAQVERQFQPKTAQKVHALIQLMRHSGLAIRDSVTLERTELENSSGVWRIRTSRQKTGTHVSVPIQTPIAIELLNVENEHPLYFFWDGKCTAHSAVVYWQYKLRELFRAVFGPGTRFTPHCLRDTFAVEMLAMGVPLEEVSKLLGHRSVKTTERSYAPWVRARQDRLDALVVATWQVQP